jgi:hypothetical protein
VDAEGTFSPQKKMVRSLPVNFENVLVLENDRELSSRLTLIRISMELFAVLIPYGRIYP